MDPFEKFVLGPEETARRVSVQRAQSVLLATDLARNFGGPTGRLNEQFNRNFPRCPEDFLPQPTLEESQQVSRPRSQKAILREARPIFTFFHWPSSTRKTLDTRS